MDNTLQHHGIKGQRWGVRRSQKVLDRLAGRQPEPLGPTSGGIDNPKRPLPKGAKVQLPPPKDPPKGAKYLNPQDVKSKIDTASKIVDNMKNINNNVGKIKSTTAKKPDLSKMTDQELRDRVNRMNLEQQFSQLSSRKISKGEQYVKNTLEIAGNTLAVAGSAVAIAVGIQQLRNKI